VITIILNQHVQEVNPNLEVKYKDHEVLAAYPTSPGELEGVSTAETVGFLSAIVVEMGTAVVLG